jgi:hypothetical protein
MTMKPHNAWPSTRSQLAKGPSGGPRDQVYAALWSAYPEYPGNCSDEDCRKLLDQLLDEGVNPDELITAAAEYAERCDGAEPRLLVFWLRCRCWEPKNHHLADTHQPVAARARFTNHGIGGGGHRL